MQVPYKPPPLKFRSTGDPVYAVKRALKKAGFARGLLPNKVYGAKTVLNVRRFQGAHGLRVDGEVGRLTLGALSPFFDDYGYFLFTGQVPGSVDTLTLPLVLSQPVHETAGLPGFPANDLFTKPGTQVIVPADCTLVWPHLIDWSAKNRVGGWTCYLRYATKTAFVTHMGMVNVAGRYAKGDAIGTVAAVPGGWWAPHIHYGLHQGIFDPNV